MDFKSSMDQLFDDREARLAASDREKLREKHDAQAKRNNAITLIDTIVEPVLQSIALDIKNRGFEARVSTNKDMASPRATLYFLVPPVTRGTSWPESELCFIIDSEIHLEWDVWGPHGKKELPSHIPKSRKTDGVDRAWFEQQVLRFVKAVLAEV